MSDELQRLKDLMGTVRPLPQQVLHVGHLSIVSALPKAEPTTSAAPWAGIPVQVDEKLPPTAWELRDEAGEVLATNRPTPEDYLTLLNHPGRDALGLLLAVRYLYEP